MPLRTPQRPAFMLVSAYVEPPAGIEPATPSLPWLTANYSTHARRTGFRETSPKIRRQEGRGGGGAVVILGVPSGGLPILRRACCCPDAARAYPLHPASGEPDLGVEPTAFRLRVDRNRPTSPAKGYRRCSRWVCRPTGASPYDRMLMTGLPARLPPSFFRGSVLVSVRRLDYPIVIGRRQLRPRTRTVRSRRLVSHVGLVGSHVGLSC
jgi:hypothetical protein